METLLLTRSEVKLLLNAQEIYQLLLDAFIDHSKAEQIRSQRVRSLLPNEESSAVVLFPGLASSIPAYTVKVHAKYPKQSPSINGVIHLHDLKTGGLLAIMDSTYITAVRTGISGVIGTNSLANKDAEELTIIGAGVQGQMHLNYLRSYRTIKRVRVFDTDPNKANEFAERMDHKEKLSS
ncbi:ornithine cyclodeaminase [Bacillus sp. JCM 19046]|nr:ornithine cyclodeaminase [Bacillus sp. JCM 19046]